MVERYFSQAIDMAQNIYFLSLMLAIGRAKLKEQ
jgi:hypothetical protein